MRQYETVFIADPDIPPDAQDNLFEKVRTLISGNGGELIDFDEWGNKRLAYEIRKKQRGHYVRLDYCGNGETVSNLENAFRIDERVLKFMTILLDPAADPEQLKAAIEANRQASDAAAKTAAESPEEARVETVTEEVQQTPESEAAEDDVPDDSAAAETDDGDDAEKES